MPETVTLLQTTVENEAAATKISTALFAGRLAACVQVSKIESRYRWKGAIERAGELRLDVKTAPSRAAAAAEIIHQHHPYEVPEIVWQPLSATGSYAAWVTKETAPLVNEDEVG